MQTINQLTKLRTVREINGMYRLIVIIVFYSLVSTGCGLGKNRLIQTPMDNPSAEKSTPLQVDTSKVPDYKSLSLFKNDTLAYLRYNFYERQGTYLNKKLEVLLHDLEIPISGYVCGSAPIDTLLSPYLYLRFHNGQQVIHREKAGKPSFDLIITWARPLRSPEHIRLARESKGKWTSNVNGFYRNQVVGMIKMMEKSFK